MRFSVPDNRVWPQNNGVWPQKGNGVWPQKGRIWLDLGSVKNIAEVTVNGKAYQALWKPPFAVDVTDAVKQVEPVKSIEIEVKVTNYWPNRLIGDARLLEDCEWDDGRKSRGYPLVKSWPKWLMEGRPSPTGRHSFTTCRLWSADEPLLEAGLLGPVRLLILPPDASFARIFVRP